jgi:hypothetical protein
MKWTIKIETRNAKNIRKCLIFGSICIIVSLALCRSPELSLLSFRISSTWFNPPGTLTPRMFVVCSFVVFHFASGFSEFMFALCFFFQHGKGDPARCWYNININPLSCSLHSVVLLSFICILSVLFWFSIS